MRLTVIGLGKLGSPFAALLATKGHQVVGIDFNEEIVEQLNNRKAPFFESGLQELLDKKTLSLETTTEYEPAVSNSDATFTIVPTPSAEKGQFTNLYILKAIEKIGEALSKKEGYHLVVITSTVMPGSMNGEIKKQLEQSSKRKVGEELGLCYNPEFIALGSVVHNMLYPDMVLIGESDQKAGKMLENIYESFCENQPPIQRMNFINAELTKLSLNTFVTTKISYANMLGAVCEMLPGSDVDVVTEAIGLDSRIGRKYLKAAVAFGGPCFPRDNVAFRSMASDLTVSVDIAEATQKINDYQLDRLEALLKNHEKGSRVGVIGLSYKPETNVVEESSGVNIANRLKERGYDVIVYDPEAISEGKKVLKKGIHFATSLQDCFNHSDMALIMTAWPEFKGITPETIGPCKLILDCWRILDKESFKDFCQIIYLGQGQEVKELLNV